MAGDPTMEPDPGGQPTPTGPPAGDPNNQAPPAGGGPILAGLMRQRQSPNPTAPGAGNAGQSMQQLKAAVDLIQSALPGLGAGTPAHTAALNALRQISRHLAQGQPPAGAQATMLMDLLRRTQQNAMFQKILGQRAAQGQSTNPDMPAGQQPDMGEAPTPSMALPGA